MDNSRPNQKFKIGDTVKLKSGGPKMTVARGGIEKKLECVWFLEGKPEYGYFPPDSLQLVVK